MDVLFSKDIIDSYKKDYSSNKNLFFKTKRNDDNNYFLRSKSAEERIELEKILLKLDPRICGGLKSYLENQLINLKEKILDFVYIVNNKNDHICGILIAEKGECGGHSRNLWSVKIICNLCTKDKGTANELMGAYIYALKKKYDQTLNSDFRFGILELAGGILNNTAGFCNYTKFGFVPNPDLDCDTFYEEDNIFMTTDVTEIEYDFLKKIVSNEPIPIENYPVKRPNVCLNKKIEDYAENLKNWNTENIDLQKIFKVKHEEKHRETFWKDIFSLKKKRKMDEEDYYKLENSNKIYQDV